MIRRPPRSTLFPLHDALPICAAEPHAAARPHQAGLQARAAARHAARRGDARARPQRAAQAEGRSEEHTSELQSRQYLVCRLLLEKKKKDSAVVFTLYPLVLKL